MTAQPFRNIVQRAFNPELPPVIDLSSQAKLVVKDNTTDAGPEAFEFVTEKFVDFDSLKENGIDIQSLFYDQQWRNYFEMLNGFVYYDIVKYFWQKATIFDKFSADEEVRKMVEEDSSLKGKTRVQLGLRPFKGKEIRSNIMGINVLITQEHVAKVLGLDNEGENVDDYDDKSKHLEAIKKDLFLYEISKADFGRAKFMKQNFNFAFRVFLASIITREGGFDTISVPHRHFIWFLYKKVKINLAELLFDHLCFTISKSRTKSPSVIHHPRLISEIIRQTRLTDILSSKEKLRVFQTAKYDANVLVNMKLVKKEDLKKPKNPLETIYENYFWCDGFPTISEHDNEDVIKNFLEIVKRDTGVSMPRSMVVSVPNWDIFKGPKEITRSRRKPQPVEQDLVEEGSQEQPEDQNDIDNADGESKEQVDSGAERLAAKERAKAKAEAAEKEKRTKKRNERPPPSKEEKTSPARPTKRIKSLASRQRKVADPSKGNISKPNADSTSEAQPLNPSPSIDYTKPLNVILPSPQPLSSSSSEGTSSDYSTDSSELLRKSAKNLKKAQKETPKKTKNKQPEETIIIDTTILYHLSTHLTGDAFTHSNTNSPNHLQFVNTTSELPQDPPVQEPPIILVKTPPPTFVASEQENSPTPVIQNDTIPHSEPHTLSPIQEPPSTPQPEPSTPEPSTPEPEPEPQTLQPEPIYGPSYKPLSVEELILPVDFALPILEDYLKKQINIDDEPVLEQSGSDMNL
ncbi:hypothetical protein QL285_052688 [Trifolium repens]|nr:hypothetical protein QL285_052688 [Trifolium repens]